jgi:hypothetical protein
VAISDIFTADSALVSIASTSQTALVCLNAASTKRAFIVGVRMTIGVTAAAAGNSVLFTLARTSNSPTSSNTVTPRPHDAASAAALSSALVAAYTIAPTAGNILAEWELPQTTGSAWEEFPPLGYEWAVGTSTSVALFVTTSVATSTPLGAQLIFSE